MATELVSICDFCGTKSSQGEGRCPPGWKSIHADIEAGTKTWVFTVLMCETCFDKTLDIRPQGLLQRAIGLFRRPNFI